jgi:opacity protein-like surface antigen
VGYATGMFMPYVTLGVAIGNLRSTTSNYGTWTEYNTGTGAVVATGTYNATGGKSGIAFGAAFGAGIEAQIVPNTFVRAEWQGVQFATPAGRKDIKEVMLHTARVGGGVKF